MNRRIIGLAMITVTLAARDMGILGKGKYFLQTGHSAEGGYESAYCHQ